MLILDEQKQAQHDAKNFAAKERQKIADYVTDQLKDAVWVEHWDKSPTNYLRQLGQTKTDVEVEGLLKKIAPFLIFEHHPHISDKKCIYRITPDGKKLFLLAYEKGIMPERSVMAPVVREHVDPKLMMPDTFHIDRADLPKHEVVPFELNDQDPTNLNDFKGGEVIWDDTEVRPGMKRTEMPWFESKRGYRQIFAILVGMELITPAQAESVIPPDNRPEWQRAMKKKGTRAF